MIFPSICLPLPSHGGVEFQDALQVEFDGLDNLLSGSTEVISLSHHMMQTRFSLDDLIIVVQASTLGSRDALSQELLKINMEAKDITAGLQQFMHAVQSTVDLILVNDPQWVLSIHQSAHLVEPHFGYEGRFEGALLRLLQTVADLQISLDHLESRFSVIRDLVGIESHTLSIARDEVLSNILTLLGFNRKQLAQFNTCFAALNQVGAHRKTALWFVIRTQHGLLDMAQALEVLWTLSAEPTLTGKSLPVEVLIDTINSGIERLRRNSSKIAVYQNKGHETLS
ncbi:hypothetical protein BD769DRAFT_1668667 [Suillus cothurnatus]|nr:hypothetical protein BD769DRAFT_1668667 [Suillus cothurnatus]